MSIPLFPSADGNSPFQKGIRSDPILRMESWAEPFMPSRTAVTVMQWLCLMALSVTGYLWWTAATSTAVLGCGGDLFECSHVLNSRWSTSFGLPVSLPAFFMYASAIVALGFVRRDLTKPQRGLAWSVVTFVAVSAGLAAAWFLSLQIFIIGHLCPWCLTAHLCGLILAGMLMRLHPAGRSTTIALVGISIVSTGILIAGQVLVTPPPTYTLEYFDSDALAPTERIDDVFEAPGDDAGASSATATESMNPPEVVPTAEFSQAGASPLMLLMFVTSAITSTLETQLVALDPQRAPAVGSTASATSGGTTIPNDRVNDAKQKPVELVHFSGGKKLDPGRWPLVGRPDAEFIFVQMFDYTCAHCRAAHTNAIRGTMKHYGHRLAIVMLAVPLEAPCNSGASSSGPEHSGACEIARIGIAVWRINPTAFSEFHDWLMSGARSPQAAFAEGARIVGTDRLRAELAKPTSSQYIAKHVELYRQIGSGSIPKLLFPNATLTGDVGSVQSLCDTIDRQFR